MNLAPSMMSGSPEQLQLQIDSYCTVSKVQWTLTQTRTMRTDTACQYSAFEMSQNFCEQRGSWGSALPHMMFGCLLLPSSSFQHATIEHVAARSHASG